jgi:hypothetical protein
LWEKQGVAGKTVLLHGEQGYGDQIQFARYAALVARRGAKVILEVRPPLVTLMRSLKGVKQVVARGDALPAFDLHTPLLDLPAIFGTILRTVPADVPYLQADPAKVAVWAERLANDEPAGRPGLRIGISWAGSPTHRQDRSRSVPLARFAPLAAATADPGAQGPSRVSFISLQKGDAGKQAANPPEGMALRDYTADLNDFSDTAALLMNIDLVISVDTSVVHLAGALARPVWTLVTIGPDWRWLEDRDTSPWYPTMKLFRQTAFDQWDDVFVRVAEALKEELRNREQRAEAE